MMHEKVAVLPQSVNLPMTQRRTCVLVLGMHRSGTSALARVLNLLGCDLPQNLMAPSKSNETGHWESEPIARFNDRLLASAGSSWDDWLAFNPAWFSSPKAAEFHEEALSLLDAEFGNSRFFVLKDPRICKLAPFWLGVLAAHGAASRMILPVRNPQEVAGSLAARNRFEPGLGQLLWLRHVLDAEHATRGRPRFFTGYDRLLRNWTSVTGGASEALELSFPCHPTRIDADVVSFLDKKRRHHEEAVEDTLGNANLSAWLRDAFRVFTDWSTSGEKVQDFALLDRIRVEFEAAAPAFAQLVTAGRKAQQKHSKLQAEHKTLTETFQAAEGTIADLRARLQEVEKTSAVQGARVVELETAIDLNRKRLLAQESTVAALTAERNALRDAVGVANDSSTEVGKRLVEVEALLAGQTRELAEARTRVAEAEDWVFRLSAERAVLTKDLQVLQLRLAEQAAKVHERTEQEELLAAQNVEAIARLEAATREVAQLKSNVVALEESVSAARTRMADSDLALNDARAAKRDLDARLSDRVNEVARLTQRLREKENAPANTEVVTALRAQVAEKESQLAKRFGEIAALTRALQEKDREASAITGTLREKEHELSAMAEALREKEREIAAERATQEQLAERFAEIARLTQLVNDAEAAARTAVAQRDWIREAASVLAGGPRTWKSRLYSLAPVAWRRARQLDHLKKKGLFDAQAYFAAHPDVARSTQDALQHYIRHGLTEGRTLNLRRKDGASR